MSLQEYNRFDLASNQLETAIMLYITGDDRFSVITLAGASDEIFSQLVKRAGKENFTDILFKDENVSKSRNELAKEINELLFINELKHMDADDKGSISIDIEECALAALLRAIVNYNMLKGRNDKLITAFLYWVSTNLDLQKYGIKIDPVKKIHNYLSDNKNTRNF